MNSERPVLVMAGGTGGHIFPGLAVARALQAQAVPVVWLGSAHGLENQLVPKAGLHLETLRISALRGKGGFALAAAPWRLLRAVIEAVAVLRRHRPRAVISFGGFAAGPGGLAAWLTRRPLLVHEQNRLPGLTNKVLAKLAQRVLCGFAHALPGSIWVGNPVRTEIAAVPPPAQRMAGRTGLRVLVLGGSQGARALNRVLPLAFAQLRDLDLSLRHQCGARMLDETRAAYADVQVQVTLEPFIDDMAAAYAEADLVIARAGALTLAEVCAAGVGSILVPFPYAVDDHQTANARVLVEAGAAQCIAEAQLDATDLANRIRVLATDAAQRLAMAQAARALAKPDADRVVAQHCLEVAA
ncbi:MAG: undecaprenyldiphospho-muramoylpentapeptide beta-N-acetylglucosaminyltransferase [Rhodanobacteraceae bacterium]|nr:undecaprenyldiphospho-muramoylpentapeptide beta-N-acetylglucosaminyltransferase [Rhodanobacteraceae bacterium]MBK7044630.1 undecaprenyldiphospho-muramoylpentapeptide beta-N-acetylglucosaminyltransferase [Rhodanobacteraceae bacterium]MBP9153314.1 undecaprenyldiphospho-muramoylpentapeptide beta-N-acetylglucosaminyltransferase [Xanthomonadales bacterium]HQW82199.1 undecaprenyldiphospho-muramoylpentapeptide beta-N-acetylglucosaminyltransferase [Pseudomonadota bacterium]